MRRFQFPLDPALRLRRQLEEQAQVELAQSQRQLERQKADVELIERRLQLHDSYRAQWQQARVDTSVLFEADHYREELVRTREQHLELLGLARERVERCLEALHQSHVDREVLDRLRDRRRAEHRELALLAEQQSVDEAAVIRWRRE